MSIRVIRVIRVTSNKKIQTAKQVAATAMAAPALFQKSSEHMETARGRRVFSCAASASAAIEATCTPSLARIEIVACAASVLQSARRQQNSTTRFSSPHVRCSRLQQTMQRMRIETQLQCEPYDGEVRRTDSRGATRTQQSKERYGQRDSLRDRRCWPALLVSR